MTRKIKLTKGYEAIIDEADFALVSKYKWRASVSPWGIYAVTWMRLGGRGQHVYLHRFLLGFPAGEQVSNINGDRLDNRRVNLKLTTASASQQGRTALSSKNTSGFRGVSFNKKMGIFKAYIKQNGKLLHLGVHRTARDAARAYNEKAVELFGEFAGLNKINEN